MHESTRTKALSALDGMREIVRREMLVQGEYVEQDVSNERLAANGALCGSRKHCAIGSLWAGAGIKPQKDDTGYLFLPGTTKCEFKNDRDPFLRSRHGLRAAYNALNDAATEFAEKNDIDLSEFDYVPIEALFEGYYGEALTKRDLLKIISAAKRKVKAAA